MPTNVQTSKEPALKDLITQTARCYADDRVAPSEREISEQIIGLALTQFSAVMAESIAVQLQHAKKISQNLALQFVTHSEGRVAAEMLKNSAVLTDSDLAKAAAQSPEHQAAIAERENLSAEISHILVEHGNEQVIDKLTANKTSNIYEEDFFRIVEGFGNNETIQKNLCFRVDLPIRAAEALLEYVGEELKVVLINNSPLSEDTANAVINQAKQDTWQHESLKKNSINNTVRVSGKWEADIELLEMLCCGQQGVFQQNLAERLGLPIKEVRSFMAKNTDIEAILTDAQIDEQLLPIFQRVHHLQDGFMEEWQDDFSAHDFVGYVLTADIPFPAEQEQTLVDIFVQKKLKA